MVSETITLTSNQYRPQKKSWAGLLLLGSSGPIAQEFSIARFPTVSPHSIKLANCSLGECSDKFTEFSILVTSGEFVDD